MALYDELFEIAKVLLAEEDYERATETLLRRVVERTGADSGLLVVREEGSYRQKFEVGEPRDQLSAAERRFSRTLVREAIERRELLDLPNILDDPRFAAGESARFFGRCAVLVAPLRFADEVYGVLYIERRGGTAGFAEEDRIFLREFAEVAGLFLLRASERETLRRRNQALERELFSRHDFRGIVTRHPKMTALLQLVAQVADSDAPVLIHGETGTGKELIAQALHCNSARRKGPLVTLHCAALPGTLLEAELFGHTAGAFTDARRERPGRLAAAHGGTLLLDEVGEIPPEAQAKLLRFLQFGELQRVGSDRTERVDVRVVAATHRDLKALCREGRFRDDLYFRLKVLDLEIPPLRERQSDVPLLLDHFLRRSWGRKEGTPRWTARAEHALLAYGYPGNVRELGHLVERACLLARGPELDVDLLPAEVAGLAGEAVVPGELPELTAGGLRRAKEASADEAERRFLRALMARYEGNVSRAAREAGLHRSFLQKLLARHRQQGQQGQQGQSDAGGSPG
jgi:Nif-specific regulatory protein/two-component system response regulator HydG